MQIWVRAIGAICENLLCSRSFTKVQLRKMFEQFSVSYAASGSRGSSRVFNWREMRYKRNKDQWHEQDGEYSSPGEGSSQMYRSMSDVPEHEHRDRRDQDLEHLRRMVRDLELELRGRCRRRNHDEHVEGTVSVRG